MIDFEKFYITDGIESVVESYERPYNREEIEKIYGKDLLNRLMNDPVHAWRADTGIELIHKEPTIEELERIWINWNAMNAKQKAISDNACLRFFGKTNKQMYYSLKEGEY